MLHENRRVTTLNRLGPPRYLLAAWMVLPALELIVVGISLLTRLGRIDPSASLARPLAWGFRNAPAPEFYRLFGLQLLGAELLWPAIYGALLVGEEIGWRGFLLPRLIRVGFSQWEALIVTGIFWGVWHAPAMAVQYQSLWGVPIMVLWCTLLGIVVGWLALASGSIWPAAIAHGANDSIVYLIPCLLSPDINWRVGGDLGASLIGWLIISAFILWLVWTRRLTVRFGTSQKSGGP